MCKLYTKSLLTNRYPHYIMYTLDTTKCIENIDNKEKNDEKENF